ncbi:hypothetical protein FA13DRAFT_1521027 [Coprinellus micaceus]|uniref:Uncharacterized protein n=1 Tax=Coprinellus micaceus TaxID=71717 RepID=A0A4Y7SK37_COPMI|nr:hypothetical protein FA13DRAFT_1521027 [Coprinellus micaceus]
MFHEDFDRSTHNSFFSVSNKQPSFVPLPGLGPTRHIRSQLPPIQTQLESAFSTGQYPPQTYPGLSSPPLGPPRVTIHPPPIVSPTGRGSGSISPESYFAAPVIEHIKRKRARQQAEAAKAQAMAAATPNPGTCVGPALHWRLVFLPLAERSTFCSFVCDRRDPSPTSGLRRRPDAQNHSSRWVWAR